MSTLARDILVVDDDPDLRALLLRWLAALGHPVHGLADGPAALAWLQHRRPALVITDLRMAGMDGIALVRELQARDPLLPIIMLSGTDSVPEALRAMHLGLAAFVHKPVSQTELLALVRRILVSDAGAKSFGK